jgi:hypothetical protein
MKVERPRARSSAAPTRENSRSTIPMRARLRRHEAADLSDQRDQCVLAQKGRLTRHVRAGDRSRSGHRLFVRARATGRCVGDEWLPVALQRLFDHRMAAALDGEVERRRRSPGAS